MDIKRAPKSKIKKKIRTAVMIVIGIAAIGGITYGLTKLKPAAPTLDPSTAVIETVKRGEMVRDVRGNGTLVPELTRWVPAPADGRVERILLKAGVEVDPSTVIAGPLVAIRRPARIRGSDPADCRPVVSGIGA